MAVGLAIGGGVGVAADRAAARLFHFDIPRIQLQIALERVALISGYKLLYQSEIVQNVASPPLSARLTVEKAIASLLEGTDLTFELTPSRVVLIRRKEDPSPSQADDALVAVVERETGRGPSIRRAEISQSMEGMGVAEILVTAMRREESLQEVPLTVAAFTAEDLEKRSIGNVQQLAPLIPNVTITGGGTTLGLSGGEWRVRGVPGVARYQDGVYLSGTRGSLQSVIELDRIEVLRGPQGTLFGKGAIGGAIQYISKPPADEFGARVRTTIGSHERIDVVANVDAPVSDSLLTKITAAKLHKEGYVDSMTTGRELGGWNEQQVRAAILWKPVQKIQVQLSATRGDVRVDGDPQVLFGVTPELNDGSPNDPYLYNFVNERVRHIGPILRSDELPGRWKTRSNQTWPSFQNDLEMLIGSLQWEIASDLSLRWLSGLRNSEISQYGDSDATEYVIFETWYHFDREEVTQELQLSRAADRYQWVVGLWYDSTDEWWVVTRWQNLELHTPDLRAAIAAAFPERAIAGPSNRINHSDVTNHAVFGEGVLQLTDKLSLTLGLRYSRESTTPTNFDPCVDEPPYGTFAREFCVSGVVFSETATFSRFTPRIALKYQWTPEVMTYATWAQGFDGGGINNTLDRRTPPQLPKNGLFPYGPQVLSNYEVGIRSDLLNGRLRANATAFYGDWKDIQVAEELIPGLPGRWITNAGAAEVKGLELEVAALIGEAFRLNLTGALLRSRYTELGRATYLTLDTPFPFSPEHSLSVGVQYDLRFSGGKVLEFRSDFGWQDETWTNQDDASRVLRPAYGLLSAGVTYQPPGAFWEISLTGSNLTNEYYRMSGFKLPALNLDFGNVAPPREFALTMKFTFN